MVKQVYTMTNAQADKPSDGSGTRSSVSEGFQELYDGYYAGVIPKREIAADQTFSHVRTIWGEGSVQRMLDVGAGEGSLLARLATSGLAKELYAVEISTSGVETIGARRIPGLREVKKFDGYTIPYPDKFFDVACTIHVLEHVEHERAFLSELARVAKRLIVEVPLEDTIRIANSIRVSRPYGHINMYNRATFKNLLETTSLNVDRLEVFGNSLAYEKYVSGKVKGAAKYIVRTGMLRLAPRLATASATYVCMASCTPRCQ